MIRKNPVYELSFVLFSHARERGQGWTQPSNFSHSHPSPFQMSGEEERAGKFVLSVSSGKIVRYIVILHSKWGGQDHYLIVM